MFLEVGVIARTRWIRFW